MTRVKIAQIIFCIAALLFVAKPFIGFGIYCHLKSPRKTNILAKIFNKRKIEDDRSSMNAFKKALFERDVNLFLRFASLLAILFPLFLKTKEATEDVLQQLRLQVLPRPITLFTGQLLI